MTMVSLCECCPTSMDGCYSDPTEIILPLGSDAGGAIVSAGIPPRGTTHIHYTNWGGFGFDGDAYIDFVSNTAPGLTATQITAGSPQSSFYKITLRFERLVGVRRLQLIDFDGPGSEQAFNFDPPLTSVSPNFTLGPCSGIGAPPPQAPGRGCVRSVANNQTGFVNWNGEIVREVSWAVGLPAGLFVFFPDIRVSFARSAVGMLCPPDFNAITWIDAETGETVEASLIGDCPQ